MEIEGSVKDWYMREQVGLKDEQVSEYLTEFEKLLAQRILGRNRLVEGQASETVFVHFSDLSHIKIAAHSWEIIKTKHLHRALLFSTRSLFRHFRSCRDERSLTNLVLIDREIYIELPVEAKAHGRATLLDD